MALCTDLLKDAKVKSVKRSCGMKRETYGGKKEERSVSSGQSRSGYAFAEFPRQNTEYQKCKEDKQINFLKNQKQSKICVNLHQIEGGKYTLNEVIFCPTNGGYLKFYIKHYKP